MPASQGSRHNEHYLIQIFNGRNNTHCALPGINIVLTPVPCCRYPRHISPGPLAVRVPSAGHARPAHHHHQGQGDWPGQPRLRDGLLGRQPRQPPPGAGQPLPAVGSLSRDTDIEMWWREERGDNINKYCSRERKISNRQQQQQSGMWRQPLWPVMNTQSETPVSDYQVTQCRVTPLPRPHCANFIYDKGGKAQMVSFETYIDTYVYSTFYLTIITAIFVFRDTICKSSINLSLLSLVDIFVSHYQISDRLGWSGV